MEAGSKRGRKVDGIIAVGGRAGRRGNNRGSSSSSGKKFFRCTTCSYVTHVKARFTKHVKYHSMPLIKCDFCDFKTPYKWNLDRHYKNHNGEGDLHCPLCNFTADIKQSLTVHVQNHHSSFPGQQKIADEEAADDEDVDCEIDEGEQEEMVRNSEKVRVMAANGNFDVKEEEEQQLSPRSILKTQSNEEATKEEEEKGSGSKSAAQEIPAKVHTARRKCVVKEAEPEDLQQKSLFLQNLALKPNVVYSVGSVEKVPGLQLGYLSSVLSSPPKLATPKSSPPGRRLSVNMTSKLEQSSSMTKEKPCSGVSVSSPVKRSREKRLVLEELAQKLVASKSEENCSSTLKNSVTITSNSTRCQFCRQRCKTSADLAVHLTVCSEAIRASDESSNSDKAGEDPVISSMDEDPIAEHDANTKEGCTSENKIFVWNSCSYPVVDEDDGMGNGSEMDYEFRNHFLDGSANCEADDLVGFETAPGVGAIHVGQLEEAEYEGYRGSLFDDGQGSVTTSRKVFRCPQPNCGFWATTASRFHVHIVGHYNMKPFECSQCSYKSNWRWDITKHIKLKAMRDPSHTKAKVLLTHESGQRNYRKYDRYLTMMQLKHSADSKLPDCSTVASKRTDVELELSPSPGAVTSSPKVSPQPKGNACSNLPMPKLTRAPITTASSRASSPSDSIKSEEESNSGNRQRPPPALVPIVGQTSVTSTLASMGRTIVEKKMLSGGHIVSGENLNASSPTRTLSRESAPDLFSEEFDVGPPIKKSRCGRNGEAKKILWKCKKCPFKHASKEIVVFHIRQYHKPKRGESVSILSRNNLTSVPQDEDEQQQHMSELQNSERKSKSVAGSIKETYQYMYNEDESLFTCKFCPFTTNGLSTMESHSENHFSKPNCNFSCTHCSFSVQTKRELIEHTQLHGWDPGQNEGEKDESLTITPEETPPRPRASLGSAGASHKKYHCTECPYVTDSKGQFLYHKQFHRPRDCPFKCTQCSYTVSHKHLLHQHLRVHDLPPLSPTFGDVPSSGIMMDEEIDLPTDDQPLNLHQVNNDSERSSLEAIHPTVLVWRNDRPFRMYRCRLCPQVYGKLGDLTEHEMSHGSPVTSESNLSPLQTQQNISISPVGGNDVMSTSAPQGKVLHCCEACPARFFYEKELEIHSTFHQSKSEFQCKLCSYSAKQENPHLMSHMKVHGYDYQMKTQQLLMRYPKAAKPRKKQLLTAPKNMTTTLNIPQPHFMSSGLQSSSSVAKNSSIVCQKCPAKFHSVSSYQHHITYHGRETNFKCRHCDYGVDNLKNLTLHEILHTGSEITSDFEDGQSSSKTNKSKINLTYSVHAMTTVADDDRIDDDAYVGNPDFIYPTYVKNGRIKSKRYKCSKCPSAFEKRDQYKVHMGLHGSDQRYKCTVCDYAVTYYANFIQHLKKHSTQADVPPELLIAKPLSKMKSEASLMNKSKAVAPVNRTQSPVPSPIVTTENQIPIPERGTKKVQKCNMCPFVTDDEKACDDHKLRHIPTAVSKKLSSCHRCSFCNFTTSTKVLLKEHVRLHFQVPIESIHSYMFSNEIDIYVNGNFDEKIYSEKENYEDDNTVDKEQVSGNHNSSRRITYIDMKRNLPVSMIGSESKEPSPEPMDCTM